LDGEGVGEGFQADCVAVGLGADYDVVGAREAARETGFDVDVGY